MKLKPFFPANINILRNNKTSGNATSVIKSINFLIQKSNISTLDCPLKWYFSSWLQIDQNNWVGVWQINKEAACEQYTNRCNLKALRIGTIHLQVVITAERQISTKIYFMRLTRASKFISVVLKTFIFLASGC